MYSIEILENIAILLRNTVNNNTKIDPIKIGKYLGFNTYLVGFDQENISGMIKNYINEKHILINKYDSIENQLFTISKLIGSYILYNENNPFHYINYFYKKENLLNIQEMELNFFASMLLIPMKEGIKVYKKYQNISNFAKYFSVSLKTATYRLQSLDLI